MVTDHSGLTGPARRLMLREVWATGWIQAGVLLAAALAATIAVALF